MKKNETTHHLPTGQVERTLDLAVEGLVALNTESLEHLAILCREWESGTRRLAATEGTLARFSWKLLLLDRLLKQTRTNLSVLGLEPVERSPLEGYRRSTGKDPWLH